MTVEMASGFRSELDAQETVRLRIRSSKEILRWIALRWFKVMKLILPNGFLNMHNEFLSDRPKLPKPPSAAAIRFQATETLANRMDKL
jgi:hypothetical protein